MFNIKKTRAAGQCAAMRCKAPATDLLCGRHEIEWKQAGEPALVAGGAPADAPEASAMEKVKLEITTEREMLTKVLEKVQKLPLETDAQIEALGAFTGKVQTQLAAIDGKRKDLVGPYNQIVKDINGWFKPLTDLCTAIISTNKKRIGARLLELEQAQDTALAVIEEGAGTAPAEAFEIAHKPVEAPKNTSARAVWVWEVSDAGKIPEAYWTRVLNRDMIDAKVKAEGADCDIPGIRLEKTLSLTVRKT